MFNISFLTLFGCNENTGGCKDGGNTGCSDDNNIVPYDNNPIVQSNHKTQLGYRLSSKPILFSHYYISSLYSEDTNNTTIQLEHNTFPPASSQVHLISLATVTPLNHYPTTLTLFLHPVTCQVAHLIITNWNNNLTTHLPCKLMKPLCF